MKRFDEQVAGTCPKNSNWFEFVGLVGLDFEAKMTRSHDGTCPRDLLQGLVAGASPLVSADLNYVYFFGVSDNLGCVPLG